MPGKTYLVEYRASARCRARRIEQPFTVGDEDFDAGDYEVERAGETEGTLVIYYVKAVDFERSWERAVKSKTVAPKKRVKRAKVAEPTAAGATDSPQAKDATAGEA